MAAVKRELLRLELFLAKGIGEFPIDMLRYDAAFVGPEVAALLKKPFEERMLDPLIKLIAQNGTLVLFPTIRVSKEVRRSKPTDGRWRSFLWNVTSVSEPITIDNPSSWERFLHRGWITLEQYVKGGYEY